MKDLIFYFINNILNKIPSRRIRMLFYHILSKKKISIKSTIGLNVTFLDIRNIFIEDYANINFNTLIDGRGAYVKIGKNVDIAPFCKIWTLEHDPNSNKYESKGGDVIIKNNAWIGSSTTILPNTTINAFSIIGAASTFKGSTEEKGIYLGNKASLRKKRNINEKYRLTKIRRFR